MKHIFEKDLRDSESGENIECEEYEDVSIGSGSIYEPSDQCSDHSDSSEDEKEMFYTDNKSSGDMRRSTKSNTTNNNITPESSLILSSSFNVPGNSACDDVDLLAELSHGAKGGQKINFCIYCEQPQSKIARHLELKHKNEKPVLKFSSLRRGSAERKYEIGLLRKKGNFLYNVKRDNNQGSLVPVRRPRTEEKRAGKNFAPCPQCRGFYTKNNLRHHYKTCINGKSSSRGILIAARQTLGRVHELASRVMREQIIPRMEEDEYVRLLRYDCLIILYGNDLCQRHRQQYLQAMIRSELRLLARFLKIIKELDPQISDLASVFNPKYYKMLIEALNTIGELNEETGMYKKPSVPYNLKISLKKVGNVLIRESIQNHELEVKKNAKDFLKLMEQGLVYTVNKTVTESRVMQRRNKIVKLPQTNDIQKLSKYLKRKVIQYFKILRCSFQPKYWQTLAEVVLIDIQIFNRKRAGELERLLISDYKNKQAITKDEESYKKLSKRDRMAAEEYVRIEIRGKLNRVVPVLLNKTMCKCIDIILKLRKEAGVSSRNPYVFGIPSHDPKRYKFLRATVLMRRFSVECGASFPETLRGTNLRKHVATKCADMNMSVLKTDRVASFLGHDLKIHKNIYRQPVAKNDILSMSRVLECAQGARGEKHMSTSNARKSIHTEDSEDTDNNTSSDARGYDFLCTSTEAELDSSIKQSESGRRRSREKKKWTPEEIESAEHILKKYLETDTLPSLPFIRKLQKESDFLSQRSPAVIKVWVSNRLKKKQEIKKNNKNL